MGHLKWLGNAYVLYVLLLAVLPIVFMFQFFIAVPQLRMYFYLDLLVPIIGGGVGLFGLMRTRGQE